MLRIAHKGASGYEPENTLAAFRKAIELGADMVELDIRTCKSGEALVIHDKFIATKKIPLKKLTLEEVQQIYIDKKERIPTLREAFAVIPKKVKIDIDIKDTKATQEVVQCIETEIRKGREYSDFLITTYNPYTLFMINRLSGRIPISFLIFFLPTVLIRLAARFPNTVSVHLKLSHISTKTVGLAHQFGLRVIAWVANNPDEINKLKHIKVDGILTDFPDRI